MNRRKWLVGFSAVGLTLAGGEIWRRQAAASSLREKLRDEWNPVLAVAQAADASKVPEDVAKRVRIWFDQNCLDVAEFAAAVCDEAFRTRLSNCPDDDTRNTLVFTAFCRHVQSPGTMAGMVQAEINTASSQIHQRWIDSKLQIAEKWKVPLTRFSSGIVVTDLEKEIERLVQEATDNVIKSANTASTLSTTDSNLGSFKKSVFLTMEKANTNVSFQTSLNGLKLETDFVDNLLALPAVFVEGFRSFLRWFSDSKSTAIAKTRESIQASASAEIARVGNEIATKVSHTLGEEIGRVHERQVAAVTKAAKNLVAETVHPLW